MKVISDKSYFDVFEKYEKKDEEKRLKKVKLHEECNKWVKKVETTVKSRKKQTIVIASLMKCKMKKS